MNSVVETSTDEAVEEIRWFTMFPDHIGSVHVEQYPTETARKRGFYDTRSRIITLQEGYRQEKKEAPRGFILCCDTVYEVTNSNPNLKVTGDFARRIKRYLSGKKKSL